MLELVHGRRYGEVCLCLTKEIELMRMNDADGRRVWVLDIAAYGQWWTETFTRKIDAYRYLRERWRISQAFWRELCADAREV